MALDRAPFATADMPATTAVAAMRSRDLEVWPVVDHDGHAIGLLSFSSAILPVRGDGPTPIR